MILLRKISLPTCLIVSALFAVSTSAQQVSALPVIPPTDSEVAVGFIPIDFTIDTPGMVTLVIEDREGKRVRNLISEQKFSAGSHRVWWDGLDDKDRDLQAAKHATFYIPGKVVAPGDYTVRGLTHPGINLSYQLTPYTNGNPPWKTSDHASEWLTNHSAPSDVIFLPAGVAPTREGQPTSEGGQLMVCSRVAEGGSGLAWLDRDGNKLWGQHWLGGIWTAASHLSIDAGPNPIEGTYAYAAASWTGDQYNDYKSELRLQKIVTPEHKGETPRDWRMGFGEDRPVLEPNLTFSLPENVPPRPTTGEHDLKAYYSKYASELTGLAVYNGLVVCAFDDNLLWLIDAREGVTLGSVTVEDPRGLAFTPDGDLLVLSGTRLVQYNLNFSDPTSLPQEYVLINDLEDPQSLTIAANGDLYISDWGSSHQIKVYSRIGDPLCQLGDAGAPQLGTYNPNHFNHPAGTAFDDLGRLWVTENFHTPKRVSIWDVSGRDMVMVDAFYGPMRYGGSGAVDTKDKTRFFYDDDRGGTIEFQLDYTTGESVPVALPYLTAHNKTGLVGRFTGAAPSYPIHHNDFLYLTDAYSLHTNGRRSASIWRLDEDDVARVVAAAGNIYDASNVLLPAFETLEMKAAMPPDYTLNSQHHLLFVWSDQNQNQRLEPNEVQFLNPKIYPSAIGITNNLGSVSIGDDLAFGFAYVGDAIVKLAPDHIDDLGVPHYKISDHEVLARGAQNPTSSGGGQILFAKDGWTITTTPAAPLARESVGAIRDGEAIWSYPSLWPGLHAGHIAPMPESSGQLIATTRVIGNVIDAPQGSDAGQLWAINSDKGALYVFTVDGLFVTRLFKDSRTASWNVEEAIPGMLVNDLSLSGECFGPTWTRTDAGEVMLQAGRVGNIIKVENLDKVKRLPNQTIRISTDQLQAALQWNAQLEVKRQAQRFEEPDPLLARIPQQAPKVDGKLDEWEGSDWVTIETRKVQIGDWGSSDIETEASVMAYEDRLYAVWKTYDDDLLVNTGESMRNLFKTGGALDMMIGIDPKVATKDRKATSGDQRLLVTLVNGATAAVLYEPIAPQWREAPVQFGSPLRTIEFDRVQPASSQVTFASSTFKDLTVDKGGKVTATVYELSIPLDLFHFKPQKGMTYQFDIGLLRGDGSQTLQRVYWHNKASGIVNDLPSEAELLPALWGKIIFTD